MGLIYALRSVNADLTLDQQRSFLQASILVFAFMGLQSILAGSFWLRPFPYSWVVIWMVIATHLGVCAYSLALCLDNGLRLLESIKSLEPVLPALPALVMLSFVATAVLVVMVFVRSERPDIVSSAGGGAADGFLWDEVHLCTYLVVWVCSAIPFAFGLCNGEDMFSVADVFGDVTGLGKILSCEEPESAFNALGMSFVLQ